MKTSELEKALNDFVNNEDIDEGNENLRKAVTTLTELRWMLATASQNHEDDYDDILECLISLN